MQRGGAATLNSFVHRVAGTGAALLVRIRHHRRPPVLAQPPGGLFLSALAGIKIRIIDVDITVTLTGGRTMAGTGWPPHSPTTAHADRGRF